ncbi:hypothetical protein GIB67_031622, partial [Kingdonia uniflora]
LLDDLNYVRWAQSVKFFVGGREQIGFLPGTEKESTKSDPNFIEWLASAPSEKVPIPPTAAEIYAKIMEKTRVFQFLAGLNPDFEYARVHLLDRTSFSTLEETRILSLRSESSVTYASYFRDPFRDFCYGC